MSRARVRLPNIQFGAYDRTRDSFEFSPSIIREALYLADGCCDICTRTRKQLVKDGEAGFFEIHHYFWLDIALCYKSISGEVLRSIRNAQVLCLACHSKVHAVENTFDLHDMKRDFLLSKLGIEYRVPSYAFFPQYVRANV